MTVRELQRRLDRLDGGDARALREVERMTDEELRRAIAQHLPDPEAFLALSFVQQDEFLVQLTRTQEATP